MSLEYILKIMAYIVFAALFSIIACKKLRSHNLTIRGLHGTHGIALPRIKIGSAVFLATLFGLYSIIVSPPEFSADRKIYAMRFTYYWKNPFTPGLNFITNTLHQFTNDVRILFFIISFLMVFLTVIAYDISDQSSAKTLKYIACSDYLIFSFAGLKQAPAIAFGGLALILLSKKKYVLAVINLAIAVLFHESALILIPVFIMSIGSNKQWIRIVSYIIMGGMLFFFTGATRFAFTMINRYLPDLYQESTLYLDSSGSISKNINILTILKGIPFYLITIQGIAKRKQLKEKIANFDEYLIISSFVSVARLLSLYMYWMERFAIYCYLPVFIFAAELCDRDEHYKQSNIIDFALTLLLAGITLRYLFLIFFRYGGFG